MSGMWRAEEGTLSRGRRRLCAALASPPRPPCSPPAPAAIPNSSATRRRRSRRTGARRRLLGAGPDRVGLILPLSAPGNAGVAAQSMKNAAEMALAEFNNPNIQLLVKDDAGTPQGAQQARSRRSTKAPRSSSGRCSRNRSARSAQVARTRSIPVIAFSTDANVAARGVYLLSFLPESDVERIVDYAVSQGKRSFAALVPDNAYGTVVEAAFKQEVARRGGRVVALEHYPLDHEQDGRAGPARRAGRRPASTRSSFRTAPTRCRTWCRRSPPPASTSSACSCSAPACGTIRASSPTRRSTAAGMRRPIRPASAISRPAIAPATARIRCAPRRSPMTRWRWSPRWSRRKGAQRFSEQMLTNSSGFAGIDGVFRFRPDGTNERGLAVLRGDADRAARSVSPAPQSFAPGTHVRSRFKLVRQMLRRQIRHHRVEHRKSRRRHAQAAVGGGLDRALLAQDAMRLGSSVRPASAVKRSGSMPSASRSPISRNSSAAPPG